LATPVITRADALASLNVLASAEDQELREHLISGLRVYLSGRRRK
jgi:hypothetical protein